MLLSFRRFVVPFSLALALVLSAVPAQAQSMYADFRARAVGDVITVILAEQTSAQRATGYENSSSSSIGGDSGINSPDINSTFGMNASFNKESENTNETVQSDLLEGTITATITEVDQYGNLMIEGERHLNVNGVTHLMRVSGMVRPVDISSSNTLLSHQIANADVEYRRDGFTRRFIKPGFLAKAGAVVALGAAVFFGMQ